MILSYYTTLETEFRRASRGKVISRSIQLGEFFVQLNFAGAALIPTFYTAFQHLKNHDTKAKPSLIMNFWDGASLQIPWNENEKDHLGLVSTFTDTRFFTLNQPGSNAVYMLDSMTSIGYYFVSAPAKIPWWESDFPLRMIFHWWLNDTAYQPIHAAAIGTENGGVLLVGKGGSGKSTSALSCINSPLKVAGDDYVLLDCEKNKAYSLFCLTKLTLHSLQLLPNLSIDTEKLNKPVEDKYRILLFPEYQNSLIKKLPVKALLLPEVTDDRVTTLTPCSSAEGMLALAPTTLFQLPGLRESSFKKMGQFVRSVPSFRLRLGRDLKNLPGILEDFISSL